MSRSFQAYNMPLESVTYLKYLGCIMMDLGNDWPVVVGNLLKARKTWAHLLIILWREGVNPRVRGMFFKSVVQEVLPFWAEKWVMTPPHMGRYLGLFQHRID